MKVIREHKDRNILLIVVLMLLAALIIIICVKFKNGSFVAKNDEIFPINDDILYEAEIEDENDKIFAHITGAVKKPGVIEMSYGTRLIEAIEFAGGIEDNADVERLNLAQIVQDEEKIYVPKFGEDIAEDSNELLSNTTSAKVDINRSTKEELMTLPGIGSKLADRIIEYRKNNKFKKIEDIMNVEGIGDKKYSEIKDLIKR